MFVGATNRFDINQGEIGNCWFLAALANLVENRRAFDRVVPAKQVSTVDIGCCCYKFEMQLQSGAAYRSQGFGDDILGSSLAD